MRCQSFSSMWETDTPAKSIICASCSGHSLLLSAVTIAEPCLSRVLYAAVNCVNSCEKQNSCLGGYVLLSCEITCKNTANFFFVSVFLFLYFRLLKISAPTRSLQICTNNWGRSVKTTLKHKFTSSENILFLTLGKPKLFYLHVYSDGFLWLVHDIRPW